MNKNWIWIVCSLFCINLLQAQEKTDYIYKDRRIINSWSTEVLPKRILDFRVGHRFGDVTGSSGGWETFYGLENSTDVLIGFDYGLTDKITIGVSRAKGAGPLGQLVNGQLLWQIASRGTDRPASLGLMGMATMSTMAKSTNPSALSYFPKFEHRFIYYGEFVAAKRFARWLSGSLGLNYVHRNYVGLNAETDLFGVTVGGRIQVSRSISIIAEATYPISVNLSKDDNYYFPLGFGLEWETGGGHIFQINLINSKGMIETDYIPYSTSSWEDGGVRLGFTISRKFKT